jgi:hypothetical protein
MDKRLLEQYESLKCEIQELGDRIIELNALNQMLQSKKEIRVNVKGGAGGKQLFHMDGYNEEQADELDFLLRKDIRILKERKAQANECVVEVDQFIAALDDSRIRRMIEYRYLDNMPWCKVALKMGKQYTEESCRKQVERFLKEIS